jgi:WD40 repeat protein
LAQQAVANQNVKVANDDIKLADLRLNTFNSKETFREGKVFAALLQAIRLGHQFRQIEPSLWAKNSTQILLTSNLSQVVYGIKEKNQFLSSGGFSRVAFSSDGKIIVTTDNTTAKLWDLEGKELLTFKGHTSLVISVAFSPDGKTIATGSNDGTIIK